eukprot:9361624-Alexandrium_andersonii.AAC.1
MVFGPAATCMHLSSFQALRTSTDPGVHVAKTEHLAEIHVYETAVPAGSPGEAALSKTWKQR